MFPEYRELISQLIERDPHFLRLMTKHAEMDQRVEDMEAGIEPATHQEIETLKKTKLALKDKVYKVLREAGAT
jgi:uncharacterized protein YdcH (DUF465 family)